MRSPVVHDADAGIIRVVFYIRNELPITRNVFLKLLPSFRNGAAARKVEVGDIVIIMAYAIVTPEEGREFKPQVVFPDTATNRLIKKK